MRRYALDLNCQFDNQIAYAEKNGFLKSVMAFPNPRRRILSDAKSIKVKRAMFSYRLRA
jgi:hypothetical protein